MENKSNEATPQRPEGDRLIDALLVTLDLPSFIKQIKEEEAWKNSDRNAITVFKTNGLRIVLVALHKDAEMKKHTANGILYFQVVEGHVQFNANEQSVELKTGQALTLHKEIPHSVSAKEETVFLLTLTTHEEEKVV